nr:hypothetical protein C23H3.8 - Caenorhabditis elegans [Caenorhabditis elegans]
MKLEISELEMEPMSPWCSPVKTRTVGLFIGIFDFLFLTATFLKSVQFLQLYGFNFFATAAVSSIGVLYAVHILCILACWYGLARQRSSWLVPKIVLKGTTVLICVAITLILAFFVSSNSPIIGNAIAHGLAKESVTLDQIDSVVITHASPGHMGNMNFFAQKPILYHSMEYIGRHVTPTELKERPYRKLSGNVEVWKTPGHTQHDLSVLVHNVAGYGTMAIVGDLIPSEHLLSEKRDVMIEEGVWDNAIKRQNANLIVCMADWIVPGHGQPFRVLPNYRQKAGCTRLLAQRHLLNQAFLSFFRLHGDVLSFIISLPFHFCLQNFPLRKTVCTMYDCSRFKQLFNS